MTLMLSDEGADAILKAYFNNDFPAGSKDLTLKLFTNDLTLEDTNTAASFVEASGGGYAAKTFTNGSWTVQASSDPSGAAYTNQTFTFTGALDSTNTVYGYYVVDDDDTLIWAEKLSTSYTPIENGDVLEFTPAFLLSKGTPT